MSALRSPYRLPEEPPRGGARGVRAEPARDEIARGRLEFLVIAAVALATCGAGTAAGWFETTPRNMAVQAALAVLLALAWRGNRAAVLLAAPCFAAPALVRLGSGAKLSRGNGSARLRWPRPAWSRRWGWRQAQAWAPSSRSEG